MSENNGYTREDQERDLQSYLSGNPPSSGSKFWATVFIGSESVAVLVMKSLASKTTGDSSSSQQPDGPSAAATTTAVPLDKYHLTILDNITRSKYTTEPETRDAESVVRLHLYAQDLNVLAQRSSLKMGARLANQKELHHIYNHDDEEGAKERVLTLIKSLETEVLPLDRFVLTKGDDQRYSLGFRKREQPRSTSHTTLEHYCTVHTFRVDQQSMQRRGRGCIERPT